MSAIVMLLKVIAIILYGAFALFLVSFVRNHAQKSIYKWLTVNCFVASYRHISTNRW